MRRARDGLHALAALGVLCLSPRSATCEARLDALTSSAAAGREPDPRPATMSDFAEQTMREFRISPDARYSLNFFGHLALELSEDLEPSFRLGDLDVLVSGKLGPELSVLAEVVVELEPEGAHLEVERLQVDYRGEGWALRGGRDHTRIGYWNQAYHHGVWIQPTTSRPKFIEFEDHGGFAPAHWVGIDGEVTLAHLGAGRLDLGVGVANGRGPVRNELPILHDTNPEKALLVNLAARQLGGRDLHAGVGAIVDWIAAEPVSVRPALPDRPILEILLNAFFAYDARQLTAIAELFGLLHSADHTAWTTFDGFVVVALRTLPLAPYGSFEALVTTGSDPYFQPTGDASTARTSVELLGRLGLRLEPSEWSALRLEYRVSSESHRPKPEHAAALQLSFGL
ncbi:MAG: hypothetical protein HYV07_32805 [Deltaproteobacteria bacterium]|nr:hypothetical protein [Deltaproteobacteria bacterium]